MDLPARKKLRMKGFNYDSDNTYFLTICKSDAAPVFCTLIPGGDAAPCVTELTETGRIVERQLLNSERMPGVAVENYVIMPDHIHMLVSVNSGVPETEDAARDGTNTAIPRLVSSFKRFANREAGVDLFQRSYYDHVIRDRADYDRHWDYIENNPAVEIYES